MILYCNSITQRGNIINLIALFFVGVSPLIIIFSGRGIPIIMYPFIILAWLVILNYCYQLKRTVYSLEIVKNEIIIRTYWGYRSCRFSDLTFSFFSNYNAWLWDGWGFFHDKKQILTIVYKGKKYYVCNKNGVDKEIIIFLKK